MTLKTIRVVAAVLAVFALSLVSRPAGAVGEIDDQRIISIAAMLPVEWRQLGEDLVLAEDEGLALAMLQAYSNEADGLRRSQLVQHVFQRQESHAKFQHFTA